MKTQIKYFGILICLMTFFTAAYAQQDKNDGKKQEKQNKGKGQEKQDKEVKTNQNKADKDDVAGQKDQPGNRGKSQDKDKKNEVRDNNAQKGNNGKNDNILPGKNERNNGYRWTRETFKDRNKYRDQEKLTLCHKINREGEPPVTITVSANALKAHLNHGDSRGECPAIKDNRFSDNFLRKRTDYYNNLQKDHEQVLYSQSILDYAVVRLAESRRQLAEMQRSNAARADIERRQAVVVELEQNVSLLQTLVGAAANLVVRKLND